MFLRTTDAFLNTEEERKVPKVTVRNLHRCLMKNFHFAKAQSVYVPYKPLAQVTEGKKYS